jgi:pimeloyl-ACP methyl ester carboxylesterase
VISTASAPERIGRHWAACFAEVGVDPRFYTSAVAMDDLDAVRAALGYERIDLYGVSYGATFPTPAADLRAVLVRLARTPLRIGNATIGIVPPGSEARVRSDVPTLLFTGLEDPQDPPSHVAGVTEAMPNARVVLVRGAGHPAFPAGCTPQLAERLLHTGTTAGIDVSCALRAPLTAFALG